MASIFSAASFKVQTHSYARLPLLLGFKGASPPSLVVVRLQSVRRLPLLHLSTRRLWIEEGKCRRGHREGPSTPLMQTQKDGYKSHIAFNIKSQLSASSSSRYVVGGPNSISLTSPRSRPSSKFGRSSPPPPPVSSNFNFSCCATAWADTISARRFNRGVCSQAGVYVSSAVMTLGSAIS